MTYVKIDVAKPGLNVGSGGNKKDLVTIFAFDEVLTYSRDAAGVLVPQIVMKTDKYMIQVYGTVSSMAGKFNTEGDEDAEGFMHEFQFSHPGDAQAILEFIQNWTSVNIGAIVESCSGGKKKQYGTPCAPLKLSVASDDTKDANKQVMTFKTSQKSPYVVGIYEGTYTLSEPAGTLAANATAVELSYGEGQLQLTDGTSAAAAISTLANPADGLVFTLLGSGGTHPSTISSSAADFLLTNGTTWTALANTWITFKVKKIGASAYKAIEL